MNKLWIPILLSFVFVSLGCGKSTTKPEDQVLTIRTLFTQLEYPKGLWVKNGQVYFTEANGRSGYGGRNALSVYDPNTHMKEILLDPIVNTEAVVVDNDGTIYLASWHDSVPGESGAVSVIDSLTHVETEVTSLEIAVVDMFIDTNNDIYVIGSSNDPSAKSIYLLRAGAYTSPQVIYQSLGPTLSLSLEGSTLYYSDPLLIKRFVGGVFEPFASKGVESMSLSSSWLFYAEKAEGRIGRINVSTKTDQTLATALHSPTAVRWDSEHSILYFLEAGTDANQYKDGTLSMMTGIR